MGQCLEKSSSTTTRSMSHHSSLSTKHVKKKSKQDLNDQPSNSLRNSSRPATTTALEPRRDLPLHKIPELLAKITGTLSSTLSSSDTKQSSSSSSSTSASTYSSVDRRAQIFERYAEGDLIPLDGLLRFCADLSLEPDSYEVLLFCYLCRAKQMYSLTKQEFLLGLKNLTNHFESLNDIRNSLISYDPSNEENQFYLWTYHYGLIDGQRCLTTANAISLWRLFYLKNVKKPLILDRWLTYLEQETKNVIPKTITCDTWTIFPQFAKFIQTNGYEAYDDSEAWPCLFDDFVEYQVEQEKLLQNSISTNPSDSNRF